jgi:hypothetical protein
MKFGVIAKKVLGKKILYKLIKAREKFYNFIDLIINTFSIQQIWKQQLG